MKKKKKKQFVPPAEPEASVQETEQEFALEDIMREFGGSEAPPQPPIPDPALLSPIPRHHTRDEDPSTQRYQPSVEDLPQRHVPDRTDSPPKAPEPSESLEEEEPESPNPAEPDILATASDFSSGLHQEFTPPVEKPSRRPEKKKQTPSKPKPAPAAPVTPPPPRPVEPPKQAPKKEKQEKKKPVKRPKTIPTPEAQYRKAAEGLKSRAIRLILCVLFTLLSLTLGVLYSQGMFEAYTGQDLIPGLQLLLLALSILCAYEVILDGLRHVFAPGFGFLTLASVAVIVTLIDGVHALSAPRSTYCPLACLLLSCTLWGIQLRKKHICYTMDPARRCRGNDALVKEPEFQQKTAGILHGKGSQAEFLAANQVPGAPQRILDFYAFAAIFLSLAAAAVTADGSRDLFLQYWSAMLLAGSPILGGVIWSRPWVALSRRLRDRGAALYGWSAAKALCSNLIVPISDKDLFPKDNLKFNGMKFFGGGTPDRVVAYGAAVLSAAKSGLAPLFEEQMNMRGARRYAVTQLRRYDTDGVGAQIGDDSVLVGTLAFMRSMGVEMPAGTRVSQAVYVAIDSTLCGVFALHYGVTRSTTEGLACLGASHRVTPIVTAGDFMITEGFLRSKFRLNITPFKIPSLPQRIELAKKVPSNRAKPCVMVQDFRFSATALSIVGSKALCTSIRWGTAIAVLSGIMGLGIMVILAYLGATGIMSLVNLGLYLLVWAIPSLLLSGWTKNA